MRFYFYKFRLMLLHGGANEKSATSVERKIRICVFVRSANVSYKEVAFRII
jgi:hypothetical protein